VLQVYPSTRPQAVVGLWLSNQRWKVKNTKKGSQLDWLYFVKLGQAYPESELVMCHIPITPFQLKNSTIPPNFISCQSNIYIYTYIYMYVTSNKSQYISYGIVIYNIICKYTYYIYMYVYIYISDLLVGCHALSPVFSTSLAFCGPCHLGVSSVDLNSVPMAGAKSTGAPNKKGTPN
jgi:hypothetical protein